LPADGQFLAFEENVEFNVFTLALVLPRVFAVFHSFEPPRLFHCNRLAWITFKARAETGI
jgi:hypothetical protein